MKRIASLCLVAAALGLAVGCSSAGDHAAAQVNGTKITTSAVVDELKAIGANQDFVNNLEAQQQQQQQGGSVRGTTPGSFDPGFVATLLLRQINYQLVHEELTRRNVALTDECKTQARSDVMLDLGGSDPQKGEDVFNKFPKAYQDLLVQRNTEVLALQNALANQPCGAGDPAADYYASHPQEFTSVCLSVIAVPDMATAQTVLDQARGGADFGALAQQYSTDDQTKAQNGSAGCFQPNELPQDVSTIVQQAQTGDVPDPIPTQGTGFLVLKVGNKQLAALDDVRSQAEELATSAGGQAFSDWLRQAQAGAHINVDPRFGTFDPASFTIKPPAAIATTTTMTIVPGQLPSTTPSGP